MGPAPFQASESELDGGISLLEINGERDLSTATQLEGPLEEAVNSPKAAVLIDLTDCTFIDSTGIAVVLRSNKLRDGDGDRVVLHSPSDQVLRVLTMVGLTDTGLVFPDRDAAIAALVARPR